MRLEILGAVVLVASACAKSPSNPDAKADADAGSSQLTSSPMPYRYGMADGGPGMMGRGPGMMGGRGPGMMGGGGPGMMGGRGPGSMADRGGGALTAVCQIGTGSLTPDARAAVIRALADERRAEALYTALDDKLGRAPGPFPHAETAERHHGAELERLLVAHSETVPTTDIPAPVALTGGAKEACRMGIGSERENIALYDELLAKPLPADVKCVFEHLRAASVEHHLPAFQRCAGSSS